MVNSMLSNENIICLSPNPWDDMWRRRHQIMSRLAKTNRVLYIEPPISIFTLLKYLEKWETLKDMRLGIRKIQNNLYICPTWNILPLNRFKFIRTINKNFVIFQLRRIIKKMNFEHCILWHSHNEYLWDFTGCLDERLVVYDCYDKYTGFSGGKGNREEIEEWEKKLTQTADIVFAVSPPLQRYLQRYRDIIYLVTNGVSESFFEERTNTNPLCENNALSNIPRPIIGYAGWISYKIDLTILSHIAENRPDWSLVLIGQIDIKNVNLGYIKKLKAMPNVHFVGEIPLERVPLYLRKMDVCLLPFKSYEQIDYCSCPLKFWEYMAMGKPIITVKLANIEEYEKSGLLKIADTPEKFVTCISGVLESDTAQLAEQRRQMARNNTWNHRVEEISRRIIEQLQKKNML